MATHNRLKADRALCSCYERILRCSFAMRPEGVQEQEEHEDTHLQEGEADLALEDKLLALRRLVISSGLPHTEFYYCEPLSDNSGPTRSSNRRKTHSRSNSNCSSSSESSGGGSGGGCSGGRKRIKLRGIPDKAAPSLRSCVWKVLLGALVVDVSTYIALMKVCGRRRMYHDNDWNVFLATCVSSYLTLLCL